MIKGEPWWVVADVCAVLDLDNPSYVIKRIEKDDLVLADAIDSMGRCRLRVSCIGTRIGTSRHHSKDKDKTHDDPFQMRNSPKERIDNEQEDQNKRQESEQEGDHRPIG
jgi:prophage antirepressor-like protein